MKLFIDSANPKEVKAMWDLGIIDGVTTNPSLATQAGVDYKKAVNQILEIVDGDVSLEVLATKHQDMIKEALALSQIHHNVVVKLPTTEEGLKALGVLAEGGIRINMTLVFDPNQALLCAKLGAYIISFFDGRLEDLGENAIDTFAETKEILTNYGFASQLLFASVRSPLHVKQAALIGADIATCPLDVLEKLVKHPLTDKGLEKFLEDFKKSKQKPLV